MTVMVDTKTMWAVCHKPSGSWNQGDAKLTLYPFEHEARLVCRPYEAFEPVKVVVTVQRAKR